MCEFRTKNSDFLRRFLYFFGEFLYFSGEIFVSFGPILVFCGEIFVYFGPILVFFGTVFTPPFTNYQSKPRSRTLFINLQKWLTLLNIQISIVYTVYFVSCHFFQFHLGDQFWAYSGHVNPNVKFELLMAIYPQNGVILPNGVKFWWR